MTKRLALKTRRAVKRLRRELHLMRANRDHWRSICLRDLWGVIFDAPLSYVAAVRWAKLKWQLFLWKCRMRGKLWAKLGI